MGNNNIMEKAVLLQFYFEQGNANEHHFKYRNVKQIRQKKTHQVRKHVRK